MAKQNKFNFKGIEKKARTTLENAMVEIGNAAKSFFVENFRKQGFDDKNVEKWQPRKKADKRAGRAILVKTGDLRRSIIRNPANRAALSVKISTDLPYAKVHNNGETINVDGRKGSGTITRSIRGSAGFKNGKFTRGRAKKVTFQGKEYTTGSYAIKMPKRQFMGDSYNLNERIKKIIVKRLDNTFK